MEDVTQVDLVCSDCFKKPGASSWTARLKVEGADRIYAESEALRVARVLACHRCNCVGGLKLQPPVVMKEREE